MAWFRRRTPETPAPTESTAPAASQELVPMVSANFEQYVPYSDEDVKAAASG